jgi:anti-sigma factor RsiW
MMSFGRRCDHHREALLDFVDRREVSPGTGAALDHLARCEECVQELEITALAIVGLRRLYDEVAAVEPPVDAWARLRKRIDRPNRPTYSLRSPVLGSIVASALVAAIGLQTVALPAVLRPDAGPVVITNRDAFEPSVRILSAPDELFTTSEGPRPAPDGEVIRTAADGHARPVTHA